MSAPPAPPTPVPAIEPDYKALYLAVEACKADAPAGKRKRKLVDPYTTGIDTHRLQ